MAKKKTFADEAKTIMNKYKPRLGDKFDKGDTLALEAMNQELNTLKEKQEQTRINRLVDEGFLEENNQFGCGGKLRSHQYGGGLINDLEMNDEGVYENLPVFQGDEFYPNQLPPYAPGMEMNIFDEGYENQQDRLDEIERARVAEVAEQERFANPPSAVTDPRAFGKHIGRDVSNIPAIWTPSNSPGGRTHGPKGVPFNLENESRPYTTRVPWWGAAAQGAGALLMNRNIDFGDTGRVTPERYNPRLVSYARAREASKRERDLAQAMVRRGARGRGTKSGLTSTILAGATGTQRIAGQQIGKSFEDESNVNVQIRNQAGQFNAAQRARAGVLNAQRERENLLINEQRRAGRIGGVTGAVTGYGKDLLSSSKYDQMMRMMEPDNFKLLAPEQQNWLLRTLGVSDKAVLGFKNTGDTAT